MLPTPRVVAIDDELKHLEGLTQGLNRYGTACLPIYFTGEDGGDPAVPPSPGDLRRPPSRPRRRVSSGSRPGFQYHWGLARRYDQAIRSLPHRLVAMYPEQADDLHAFLNDRLQDVPKPFAVQALNKNDHLDPQDGVKSPESLIEAIERIIAEQPQIGAILNWEERVLGAAADAVSSIMELAESAAEDVRLGEEVGRLLASLAVAAVGEEHAGEDQFRAVNEGLLPILGDRIASMRLREADSELWQAALGQVGARLSLDEAARLNRLLHIAPSTPDGDGVERGAVITLPEEFSGEVFAETFDLTPEEAAEKQFWRKQPQEDADPSQWVLVQTQAACDYAQTQPGPLPFHLGLRLPASEARRGTPPAALWRSPCFEHDGQPHFLHVSARFQVSLPGGKARQVRLLFRLREQLLNDLIYQIHGYGARPGIISFRESR